MRHMIKKAAAGILVSAAVLTVGSASVFAAGPGYGRNSSGAVCGGICSYAESACRYIDSDQDGICDNRDSSQLTPNGSGRNFTDTDNDGVCDNYGAGQRAGLCGGHNGHHRHHNR